MTWRRARVAACVAGTLAVLGLLSACNSPTLPTPPPIEPFKLDIPEAELLPGSEQVALSGIALPGATVLFLNRSLLATDIERASGVALATLDTGQYRGFLRIDLACNPTNVIDISQRDGYGRDSEVRTFTAPNSFGDAERPSAGGAGCADAGAQDSNGEGGSEDGAGADGAIE
jgi:hypothetical protein